MSEEAVNRFLENLEHDARLQAQLRKAAADEHGAVGALVRVAISNGYDFTETDFATALATLRQNEVEALNEDQAAAVVGGASPPRASVRKLGLIKEILG